MAIVFTKKMAIVKKINFFTNFRREFYHLYVMNGEICVYVDANSYTRRQSVLNFLRPQGQNRKKWLKN